MMMASRGRANRSVRPTHHYNNNNKKSILHVHPEEESSIASNDSVGPRIQIPQAFLTKLSFTKPTLLTPKNCQSDHHHMTTTNSRVHEDAKVQNLVLQAKRQQEVLALRQSHQESRIARSLSVKLPAAAYHQQASPSSSSRHPPASKRRRSMFKGKSWTSSAAVESFSKIVVPENRLEIGDGSISRRKQTAGRRDGCVDHYYRHRTDTEDTKQRWRSWLPRFSTTTKSTLVHV